MTVESVTAATRRADCIVKDGRFVIPCDGLERLIEGYAAFSKAKGIRVWQLYSRSKGGMTRSYVGIKNKEFPDGFLFNFCPVCGHDISAPFAEEDEQPTPAEGGES